MTIEYHNIMYVIYIYTHIHIYIYRECLVSRRSLLVSPANARPILRLAWMNIKQLALPLPQKTAINPSQPVAYSWYHHTLR